MCVPSTILGGCGFKGEKALGMTGERRREQSMSFSNLYHNILKISTLESLPTWCVCV